MKSLLAAIFIDLLIGDPVIIPHPVVLIGDVINKFESLIRSIIDKKNKRQEILGGVVLVIFIVVSTYITTLYLVKLMYLIHKFIGIFMQIWFIASTIAIKGLLQVGYNIYSLLKNNELEKARLEVNKVVGRDTDNMSRQEIIRAIIETLAENTSDGIIAPVFYYFLGGLPLAMTYKAVNTLDSMLGYKNKRYKYFGWASARLDDIANFIPARLTGIGFAFAAFVTGQNWKGSIKFMLRDAKKHPSWNAGYPEAAVAGAVGIRLGGVNYYDGQKSFRAYMGSKERELITDDINKVIKLIKYNVFILVLFLGILMIL